MFAFLTRLLPPWELSFIDYHNDELTRRMIFIHGTIVPYWKDAVGLGSFICHTKSQKNGWKSRPSCRWGTLHRQEKVVEHDRCKKWFDQWSKSKKTDGNGDWVVDDEPLIDKRKSLSTLAVKGVLNNGEHTLIPVTVKMIHSAVRDCKRFVLHDALTNRRAQSLPVVMVIRPTQSIGSNNSSTYTLYMSPLMARVLGLAHRPWSGPRQLTAGDY